MSDANEDAGNPTGGKENLGKYLMIGFTIAMVGYITFFGIDQHLRTRKGGWEVTFTTNQHGFAQIAINQPYLGIKDVRVTFLQERTTNPPKTMLFVRPEQPIPFGTIRFEDLTYLPGSEAFDFFGHEVELLPRTLYLNQKEHPWKSGEVFELKPSEKLPASAFQDPRKKKRGF
jgi:hypothetical protein